MKRKLWVKIEGPSEIYIDPDEITCFQIEEINSFDTEDKISIIIWVKNIDKSFIGYARAALKQYFVLWLSNRDCRQNTIGQNLILLSPDSNNDDEQRQREKISQNQTQN